jgi:hypothetical protein
MRHPYEKNAAPIVSESEKNAKEANKLPAGAAKVTHPVQKALLLDFDANSATHVLAPPHSPP